MAIDRRSFLGLTAGALAALPRVLAAREPGPDILGTWQDDAGAYHLGDARQSLDIPLPGRGHDISVAPGGDLAVVFARRPGRFLVPVEPATGNYGGPVWCPENRHLYGHGVFSSDGNTLFVAENAFETGEGRIAVLDVREGFRRIGELPSHGIGPHDLGLWPGSDLLVVANGGIRTHPDTGREKLNLATMEPSLVLLDPRDGQLLSKVTAPAEWHQLSLRHIDVSSAGIVAVGGQWEGDRGIPAPLLATWDGSGTLQFIDPLSPVNLSMAGYVGSVAINRSGTVVAATSPVGGLTGLWDLANLSLLGTSLLSDVCGLCPAPGGHDFVVSTGLGLVRTLDEETGRSIETVASGNTLRRWDNHLMLVS